MSKFDVLKSELSKITDLDYPLCINVFTYITSRNLEDGEESEICLCGQDNLRTVHIFKYNDISINIGSKCVEKFEKNLKQEYKTIIETFERDKNYKECLICNELNINIKTKYKKEFNNDICKKCSKRDKIDCINEFCKYRIPIEKDYKGEYKRYCWGCYKNK